MMHNLLVDVPLQPYPGGSPEEYAQKQKMLRDMDAPHLALSGDIRNPGDLDDAVNAGLAEFGSIDIAVWNAGISLGLNTVLEMEQ